MSCLTNHANVTLCAAVVVQGCLFSVWAYNRFARCVQALCTLMTSVQQVYTNTVDLPCLPFWQHITLGVCCILALLGSVPHVAASHCLTCAPIYTAPAQYLVMLGMSNIVGS